MVNNNIIKDFLQTDDINEKNMYIDLLSNNLEREFRDISPRKMFFFPKMPKVYVFSKSLYIEMPSYGSRVYQRKITEMRHKLREDFIVDVHYFDGKTTFIIRGEQTWD